jgi:hypothetical protein
MLISIKSFNLLGSCEHVNSRGSFCILVLSVNCSGPRRHSGIVGELEYLFCQETDIYVTILAHVSNVDEERFYVPDDQRVRKVGAAAAATHNTEPSVNYSLTEVFQCQCKH